MKTDWTALPQYKVERATIHAGGEYVADEARQELARRYAEQNALSYHSQAHRARLRAAWLKGFAGDPNPHRSNFSAPYARAWRKGHDKRHELEVALAGEQW